LCGETRKPECGVQEIDDDLVAPQSILGA